MREKFLFFLTLSANVHVTLHVLRDIFIYYFLKVNLTNIIIKRKTVLRNVDTLLSDLLKAL